MARKANRPASWGRIRNTTLTPLVVFEPRPLAAAKLKLISRFMNALNNAYFRAQLTTACGVMTPFYAFVCGAIFNAIYIYLK